VSGDLAYACVRAWWNCIVDDGSDQVVRGALLAAWREVWDQAGASGPVVPQLLDAKERDKGMDRGARGLLDPFFQPIAPLSDAFFRQHDPNLEWLKAEAFLRSRSMQLPQLSAPQLSTLKQQRQQLLLQEQAQQQQQRQLQLLQQQQLQSHNQQQPSRGLWSGGDEAAQPSHAPASLVDRVPPPPQPPSLKIQVPKAPAPLPGAPPVAPLGGMRVIEKVNWVQCNNCQKWRTAPLSIDIDALPEYWQCSMNTWAQEYARCSAAEEEDNTLAVPAHLLQALPTMPVSFPIVLPQAAPLDSGLSFPLPAPFLVPLPADFALTTEGASSSVCMTAEAAAAKTAPTKRTVKLTLKQPPPPSE